MFPVTAAQSTMAGAMSIEKAGGPTGIVVRLAPEHGLARAEKRFLTEWPDRCPKCGSESVVREPLFLRCRCCGKLARLANASLADQEVFERRSGLRRAS